MSEEAPAKPKRVRKKKADVEVAEVAVEEAPVADEAPAAEEAPAKPKRVRKKKVEAEAVVEEVSEVPTEDAAPVAEESTGPARRGWWQRTFGE